MENDIPLYINTDCISSLRYNEKRKQTNIYEKGTDGSYWLVIETPEEIIELINKP